MTVVKRSWTVPSTEPSSRTPASNNVDRSEWWWQGRRSFGAELQISGISLQFFLEARKLRKRRGDQEEGGIGGEECMLYINIYRVHSILFRTIWLNFSTSCPVFFNFDKVCMKWLNPVKSWDINYRELRHQLWQNRGSATDRILNLVTTINPLGICLNKSKFSEIFWNILEYSKYSESSI